MKNVIKILVLLIGFALPIDSLSKGHEHDDHDHSSHGGGDGVFYIH